MSEYSTVNFLAFAALAAAGIVPFLMAIKNKVPSIRILSLLLGLFAISHGLYHLAFAYDQYYLGEVLLEPVSVVSLLGFGLYYSKKAIV